MANHRTVRFLEMIGRGGFGEVFLVEVQRSNDFIQRMALKLLREDVQQPHFIARFRDEARLLAQLNHDNIVKVIDLGIIHDRPAVFMEHIPGINLAEVLQFTAFPPKAALEVAAAAADALDAAHTAISIQTGKPLAVIRRDIKPANLLLTQFGHLKVLDFGIAKANFDREAETRSFKMGTPRYMAPERWHDGAINDRADVYALGVTLLEVLTGTPMLLLQHNSESFSAHVEQELSKLAVLGFSAAQLERVKGILRSALAFSPERRPSASTLCRRLYALSDAISGEGMRRFAQRVIPNLIQEQRTHFSSRKLPATDQTLSLMSPIHAPKAPAKAPVFGHDKKKTARIQAVSFLLTVLFIGPLAYWLLYLI